jgi:hypothetical protein
MSIIQGNAHTSAGGGFNVERSLRFNSADSAYLNRTMGAAATSNTKTTFSCWVKRSTLGSLQYIFASYENSNVAGGIYFTSGDIISIYLDMSAAGSDETTWSTTAVFRDVSAWYHVVVSIDVSQATNANKVLLYVNGVSQTLTASQTGTIVTTQRLLANGASDTIGKYFNSSGYGNFYLTEYNVIDGQALTPSSFGETDTNTGVWKPKAYSGTYGTNGFYLKFADNSGTTSTTLGKDSSGNGNNWTPNNFSVTAGSGNDSLVDSPTSYGTDSGLGAEVRGNYATWNPLAKSLLTGTFTFSNGNLDVSDAASSYGAVLATLGASSGKWYWEVTCVSSGGSSGYIGIVPSSATDPTVFGYPGAGGSYSYSTNGQKFTSNSGTTYGATYTTGDIIGVALDLDAGTLVFYKNGSSQGTAFSSLSGSFVPSVGDGAGATQYSWTANFGQRAFAYTAPSGFKSLVTQNLPTPTIGATSTTQAGKYFNTVLYTGNGSTQSITGVGFQPDFVWAKARSAANWHILSDVVRGATSYLHSNNTDAEGTNSAVISSFNSDGFTLGSNATINGNGNTNVAWNWKANGAGSSNTAGTITSTVSANTTAGFSIVTYTGTGANATVGHGLGVAPSMVIVKQRGGTTNWTVYHAGVASDAQTDYLSLNLTDAAIDNNVVWNDTAPTTTVFSLGTGAAVNTNTGTYVAYCFAPVAGYSAFGSYTGNGSADGPFVFTNFRPRYLMVKEASGTSAASGNWVIHDAVRDTYNVCGLRLVADNSYAEGTVNAFDFLSNGFKLRTTDVGRNESGGTYIYMALAENPFKYSLGR